MSKESVEIITRMYSAWNSGDMDALVDVFDPEAEVRPALSTFLASSVYRGHDGVAAWYAETYEPWAEMTAEPQRFIDAGERTVVVVGLLARVPGGEVDLEGEIAHVVTIRDAKIVKLDGYDAPEAALGAVGLEG
jgi:ketosteroid isomerase-like protein